jgi:hypothetical protein
MDNVLNYVELIILLCLLLLKLPLYHHYSCGLSCGSIPSVHIQWQYRGNTRRSSTLIQIQLVVLASTGIQLVLQSEHI